MLGLGALALAGCGQTAQSDLFPAGPVAKTELQLIGLAFWIMVGVGVIVVGLLLAVIFRFRARKGDTELPEQVEGNTRLEFVWTIIPVLLLAVLAVPTIKDSFAVASAPAQPAALQVKVIGHQWWWEFDYPSLGIVTADEMHIPAGQPVAISLESVDVIHSFWVPRLAGKTDAIPGRTNSMWLEASQPGDYSGQCAQFCGTSHALMRFSVIAESQTSFNAWVQKMQHPSAAAVKPTSGEAAAGYKVFSTAGCSACHTIDGTSFKGTLGPNLTNLGLHNAIAAENLPNTDAGLARWLADPPAVMPDVDMPNLHLTQDQIKAVSAYLEGMN
jgi:cytochrome c oxidase subunit 2